MTLTSPSASSVEDLRPPTSNEDKCCSVCLETIRDDLEPLLLITRCRHYYHCHCLWSWFEHQANCPVCRHPVYFSRSEFKTIRFQEVRGEEVTPSLTGVANAAFHAQPEATMPEDVCACASVAEEPQSDTHSADYEVIDPGIPQSPMSRSSRTMITPMSSMTTVDNLPSAAV